MQREDVRLAVATREDGLRRVRRLTFRIGAAGLACSAAITVAFGHLSGSAAASGNSPSRGSAGGGSGQPRDGQPGSGQPGSGQPGGTQQPGGGSLQAPAQNVAPAQGPAQGVSGGS